MVKAWKKLKEEVVFTGHRRRVLRRTFMVPDGRVVDFDIKLEGNPVCILAFTPENNVVLAKQFRAGPEKVVLELPGGSMEKDETPAQAAARELLEETGYAGDLQYVGPSLICAYSTGTRHNFVALDCRRVSPQKLDENEFIDVVEMPFEDFLHHLRSGKLTDVTTGYLGLMHLGFLV